MKSLSYFAGIITHVSTFPGCSPSDSDVDVICVNSNLLN
jgi:hypothetical protein